MPDRSLNMQTSEVQSDNSVPIGIPLAAVIAVLFLFGSTFFNASQQSFETAAPRLSTGSPTHH